MSDNSNGLLFKATDIDELKKLVVFGDLAPDVVAMEKIYDPDTDGLNPDAKGKIIPAARSVVVEKVGEGLYTLWIVDYVDERKKTHLVRPQFVMTDDDAPNRIVGYGNDTYMLFYDIREDGTIYLQLDRKLVFYGTRMSYYRLVKTDANGNEFVICRRQNSTDHTIGTAIPIMPIDPKDRDIMKTFSIRKDWNVFVEQALGIGDRDWESTISFNLKSNINTAEPSSTTSAIFHSADRNGRFGVYYDRTVNQIIIWINRGTAYITWTIPGDDYIGKDTTIRFAKFDDRIMAYLNGVRVINSTVDAGYASMWQAGFAVPFTEGDLNITAFTLTDRTLERQVWEAPYSDMWVSLGLTSPVVLKGEDCIAVDDVQLTDGETIRMIVFEEMLDNLNTPRIIETMTITLLAREATTIQQNDISSVAIVGLEVDLNGQITKPEDWVLRRGQDPKTLSMTPKLVYEDGTVQYVSIDDICCFCYGFDEIFTEHVGMEFNLLFKYFPARNKTLFPDLRNRTDKGMLSCTKTVKIIPAVNHNLVKLSPVPVWDSASGAYKLQYYPYTKDHRPSTVLPDAAVQIVLNSFTGGSSKFGQNQLFVVSTMVTTPDGYTEEFKQTITMQLNNYANYANKEPWLISTQVGDVLVFGSNSEPYRRPMIKYNAANQQYYIDKSIFDTLEKFMLNFYTAAQPPMYQVGTSAVDAEAPVPTHFVLRSVSTGTNMTVPILIHKKESLDGNTLIDVLSFQDPFNISYVVSPDEWVGRTMLMEFLQENSGVYSVLYGVPVEIRGA